MPHEVNQSKRIRITIFPCTLRAYQKDMTQKTNSHLKRELKDIRKASRDIVEISINQNF